MPETTHPDTNSTTLWYFAIGSMMNPLSLKSRGLTSLQSFPGKLLDYELNFFGPLGFAEAVPKKGCSFHGVLHLLTQDELQHLDKIELGYKRQMGRVELYNSKKVVLATVYTRPKQEKEENNKFPQERYLDVMIQGCLHYRVDPQHIEFLQRHAKQDRPQPHEFKSIMNDLQLKCASDPLLFLSARNVVEADGEDGRPLYCRLNGHVLEAVGSEASRQEVKHISSHGGEERSLEVMFSRVCYDPKYGIPKRLEDFTKKHAAYRENEFCNFVVVRDKAEDFKIVGRIQQEYKEEEEDGKGRKRSGIVKW